MSGKSSSQQTTAQQFSNASNLTQDQTSQLAQMLDAIQQQVSTTQQTGTQTGQTTTGQTYQNTSAQQQALQQAQQQQQQQQQYGTTAGQTAGTTAGQVGPWGAAAGNLTDILSGLKAQYGNVGITPTEASAFGQLTQNAQNTPNWAPQAQNVASGFLGGDPTGLLGSALNAYKTALNPIATGSLDPRTNPGTADLLASVRNDVQNSVNGQFAGAGRDLSGLNQQYLARGITGAEAPILLNQYNANVANRMGAAGNLFGAAGTTAGAMGGNQQNAFNLIPLVEQLRNAGPQAQLAVQSAMRNLPVGALGQLSGITAPIAALGQTTAGQTTGTQTGQTGQTGQMTGQTTGQQYGTTTGQQAGTSTTNQFTQMLTDLLTQMAATQTNQEVGAQTGTMSGTQAGTQSGSQTGTSVGTATQPWSQTWAQFMSPFKFSFGGGGSA